MVAGGISNVMLSGQPGEVAGLLGALIGHRNDLDLGEPARAVGRGLRLHRSAAWSGKKPWPAPQQISRDDRDPGPGRGSTPSSPCSSPSRTWRPAPGATGPRRRPTAGSTCASPASRCIDAESAARADAHLLGGRGLRHPPRHPPLAPRARGGDAATAAGHGDAARGVGRSRACGPTRAGRTSWATPRGASTRCSPRSGAARRSWRPSTASAWCSADRFAAVGEIATGLAHEIKNPLAGLSGALELMAEDLAQDPRHAEVVGEMRHQVQRLTNTMESLLSFARPPKARLRAADVNVSLEKVLFLIRQQCRDGCVSIVPDLGARAPARPRGSGPARAGLPEPLPQRLPRDAAPARARGSSSARARGRGRSTSRSRTAAPASPPRPAPTSSSRSTRRRGRGTASGSPSPPGS